MLNTAEIVTRIQDLMVHHKITAAAFAEKIGVQRSLVSHVLSGRNKPSLDFLAKVEHAFPEVDFIWLLKGDNLPSSPTPTPTMQSPLEIDDLQPPYKDGSQTQHNSSLPPDSKTLQESKHTNPSTIVHYYPDGSFDVFHKR